MHGDLTNVTPPACPQPIGFEAEGGIILRQTRLEARVIDQSIGSIVLRIRAIRPWRKPVGKVRSHQLRLIRFNRGKRAALRVRWGAESMPK